MREGGEYSQRFKGYLFINSATGMILGPPCFHTSVSESEPTEDSQRKEGQCHVCTQVDSQGGQLEVIDHDEDVVLIDDGTHL